MNALVLVGVNGLFAVTGIGLLAVVGAIRAPRDAVRLAGAAWLAGLAVTAVVGGALLPLGVSVTWLLILIPMVALAAGLARLRSARTAPVFTSPGRPAGPAWQRLLAAILAGLTLLVGSVSLRALSITPLEEYDGWAIWGMKARALAALGSADPVVFASSAYTGAHLEYPLGLPFVAALPLVVSGSFDSNLVVLQIFLIGAAGLAALWSLLRDRVRPLVLWAWLAAIAATPAVMAQLGTGYGDIPLAVFVATGVVCLARLAEEGRTPHLALAAVFLTAAALSKNEGVLFAAAALLATFVAAPARRRGLLLAGGCVLVALVPWQVWASSHGLRTSDYDLASSFDPGYVLGRLGRVRQTLEWYGQRVVRRGDWVPLPVITFAAVAAGVALRRSRVSVIAALFAVLSFAGLAWIYLISPLGVYDFLDSNGARVIASVVLGTAALGPIVVEDLLGARAPESTLSTPRGPRSQRGWSWQ